jgi:hypothetical protein
MDVHTSASYSYTNFFPAKPSYPNHLLEGERSMQLKPNKVFSCPKFEDAFFKLALQR